MSNFDEKSGIVPCPTPWGKWWQTIEDVTVEVNVSEGTKAKEVHCSIKPNQLELRIGDTEVIKGQLTNTVMADDSVWTLEDRKMVRICLIKADRQASNCWSSLLVGQYSANSLVYDEMQKNMTLQRFQFENPGMDFSGAAITGSYQKGGPQLPT